MSASKINISNHLKSDWKAIGNSKVVAGLLALFLGGIEIHRLYLGDKEIAFIQLGIFIVGFLIFSPLFLISGIWALIDTIQIFTGKLKTVSGEVLV
ncbi:NINE protein [Clostridium perfringens]